VTEPAPAPKVAFKTLGCRLNQAESEQALEALGARGFDLAHAGERPDVVVINTCTVTAESTASSRRLIRKTAEAHPDATVVVTGCYAVAEPEEVRAIPGVDLVIGNDHKDRIAELVTAVPAVRRLPLLIRPAPAERLRTRVAVKAQTGCDEWCTFCIIPRTRGPLRSHPEEQVVADVRRQVERGVREVVLTGVHLGKYGEDRGEREALARLVDRLTAIDGLLRLRLSSVLPVQVTPALVERVRDDPKVCRHLHVPLQAGDDEVLARMHRPYRIAEFLDRVEHAKAEVPGLGLSTDVIVGFPGETRAQFAATMAVVERVGFSKLHVFRYSQRPDTPAATMPDQVPGGGEEGAGAGADRPRRRAAPPLPRGPRRPAAGGAGRGRRRRPGGGDQRQLRQGPLPGRRRAGRPGGDRARLARRRRGDGG